MRRSLAVPSAVLFALSAASVSLAQLVTPAPSPNATVSQMIGVTKVEIAYSRPHVKGPSRKEDRVIWGGLVPYGQVWRTGANAVTRISFDGDVSVEGHRLAAGSYGLFTIPGKDEWIVIFNTQDTGFPTDYKAERDILRVKVKPRAVPMRDTFTIDFPEVTRDSAELALEWDKLAVVLNMAVDTNAQFLANAKAAVASAKSDDWRTPFVAARFLYDSKYALSDAAAYLEKSVAIKPTFANLSFQAGVLAGEGKKTEAVAAAHKALALKDVEPKPSADAVAGLEKKLGEWTAAK
jgi:hypothetical protein